MAADVASKLASYAAGHWARDTAGALHWETTTALRRIDALTAVRCIRRGRHSAPHNNKPPEARGRRNEPLWIHVVGDSTMRFLYAAFLSLLNGTEPRAEGFPRHWMPSADECSFIRHAWETNEKHKCFRRWRGTCYNAPCTLEASGLLNPAAPAAAVSARSGAPLNGAALNLRHHRCWTTDTVPCPQPWLYPAVGAPASGAARWRLTFEWYQVRRAISQSKLPHRSASCAGAKKDGCSGRNRTSLALFDWLADEPRQSPTVVLLGDGVHEAVGGYHATGYCNRTAYEERLGQSLNRTARRLIERLAMPAPREQQASPQPPPADAAAADAEATAPPPHAPAWVLLVGNGACRTHQIRYWGKGIHTHPPPEFEAHVTRGNEMLARFAAGAAAAAQPAPRVAFLDRSTSMQTVPKENESACSQHHPYGQLSATHVQFVLNALVEPGCA